MTNSTVADRYVLGDLLGSGGMADVYRATDTVLERQVAVKLLRPTTTDQVARARFAQEARTLAALNHPGLVTVLDAGITSEHPFLVMELVEGSTLAQHLAASGPLDADRLRDLGTQLSAALAYAHRSGVIHRDLKPANILMRPDGTAVVTDFGIARHVTDAAQHTGTGEVIGSPAYLAPEQVSGSPLSPAVDVYALGLVLLECFTGRRAYDGPPVEAAIARLSTAPAIPVSLARDLRDLLVRMTAVDPAARPSAAEVLVGLGGALVAAGPTTGTAPTAAAAAAAAAAGTTGAAATAPLDHTLVGGPVRRRRTGVLLGAAGVAAAVAIGLVGLTGFDSPEAVGDTTAAPPAVPTERAEPTPTAAPTTAAPTKPVAAKVAPKKTVKPKAVEKKAKGKGKPKKGKGRK